jgi:hypothetical protein
MFKNYTFILDFHIFIKQFGLFVEKMTFSIIIIKYPWHFSVLFASNFEYHWSNHLAGIPL